MAHIKCKYTDLKNITVKPGDKLTVRGAWFFPFMSDRFYYKTKANWDEFLLRNSDLLFLHDDEEFGGNRLYFSESFSYLVCDQNKMIPDWIFNVSVSSYKTAKKVILHSNVMDVNITHCDNLEKIEFPEKCPNLTFINFRNNRKLKSITLPDGDYGISWECFANCESLETVVCPSHIKHINMDDFIGCPNLKNLKVAEDCKITPASPVQDLSEENVHHATIKESLNELMSLGEKLKELLANNSPLKMLAKEEEIKKVNAKDLATLEIKSGNFVDLEFPKKYEKHFGDPKYAKTKVNKIWFEFCRRYPDFLFLDDRLSCYPGKRFFYVMHKNEKTPEWAWNVSVMNGSESSAKTIQLYEGTEYVDFPGGKELEYVELPSKVRGVKFTNCKKLKTITAGKELTEADMKGCDKELQKEVEKIINANLEKWK